MRTTVTSTYSQSNIKQSIMDNMDVTITVANNPLDISIDNLFKMAARVNKKRGFLFVSKVLGKHIPVHPLEPLLISGLLAILYYESKTKATLSVKNRIIDGMLSQEVERLQEAYALLKEQPLSLHGSPLIIGFAETATALGQGVYDCLEAASFVQTTREEVRGCHPTLAFQEEHSHAVDQRCFVDVNLLQSNSPIILVDDEVTTGKTVLNTIRAIHSKFPREEYAVLSILDWRSADSLNAFDELEQELGVHITTASLLSGQFTFHGKALETSDYDYQPRSHKASTVQINHISLAGLCQPTQHQNAYHSRPFIHETGRFGLLSTDREKIEQLSQEAGAILRTYRQAQKTLCLGTGEFMYLPMKIATHMGEGIRYHSTTRSPIHPIQKKEYAVQNGYRFKNPEDQRVTHYLYNLPQNAYQELFFFVENPVTEETLKPIISICHNRGIEFLHVVTFSMEGDSNE